MIDREATERDNKRLVTRLKFASLRQARAFARSIRGGGCVVHAVRKI